MQMAAPKPQSTGELFHVCFCPYLSLTALCWVSVTAAPKAAWLLTPGQGQMWGAVSTGHAAGDKEQQEGSHSALAEAPHLL